MRSGSDHDWYALDSKTDDGLGIAPEPGVALGRDRICFLFTMSDRFQACPETPQRQTSVRAGPLYAALIEGRDIPPSFAALAGRRRPSNL